MINLNTKKNRNLNEKEQNILRSLVNMYILTAAPIGSRSLSKYLQEQMKISPASIRNIMSDLEELEFINQPHTSAGRVPTDKGYRFFVDSILEHDVTGSVDINKLRRNIVEQEHSEAILKEASKVLGQLSNYLSIVRIPYLVELIIYKVELMQVATNRILVVFALDSNIVKTVTIEAMFEVEKKNIDEVTGYINERVAGMPLKYLKENFQDMIKDFSSKDTPLISLFVQSIEKVLNNQKKSEKVLISGTKKILEQPEFGNVENVKSMIELIENEDIIIHLLDNAHGTEKVNVLIGGEMQNSHLNDYSVVLSSYKMSSATGSIGLIGPKRMDYPKMMSIVQNMSSILSGV